MAAVKIPCKADDMINKRSRKELRKLEFLRAAAFLLLSILYYLLPWKQSQMAACILGLPFLLAYAILPPGLVLRSLLLPSAGGLPEKLTSAFMFGLSYLLLVSFVWALFGGSLHALIRFLPLLLQKQFLCPATKPLLGIIDCIYINVEKLGHVGRLGNIHF